MAVAFREFKEIIHTEDLAIREAFKDAGVRLRGVQHASDYIERLTEVADFYARVLEGKLPVSRLQEAMSTSDFPILFGDILDRQMLANYQEWPAVWPNFCKRGTVRDFRQARRIALDGLEGSYYPSYAKAEMEEHKEANDLAEAHYLTSVEVYEKGFGINWRMLINDDLDALRDLPQRLARGARRTESKFATNLYCDANGPHASLYTGGNGNIITSNAVFSIAALQLAFGLLGKMVDANGEPIVLETVELVVAPALEIPAQNVLNATELWLVGAEAGSTANQQLHVANWMRNRTRLSIDPYIPIVVTTGTRGDTSWFLFANPNQGRPALEVTFLRGYEQPSLYQKMPNMMRVGGGVDPTMGDFESNTIQYKGMHIIGGTRMSPKATMASNGTGA